MVGDDQVGARLADEVDHQAPLLRVGGVDVAVRLPERRRLRAADLRRPPRLFAADVRDLLRGVDEAAAVAARDVAHHDLVAALHEPSERAAAENLEIVGMSPHGEDLHTSSSAAKSKSVCSTCCSASRTPPSATASSPSCERMTRGATGTSAWIRCSSGPRSCSPAREMPPPTITVAGFRTTIAAAIPRASRSSSVSSTCVGTASPAATAAEAVAASAA